MVGFANASFDLPLTSASYNLRANLLTWAGSSFTWDTLGQMTSMQGQGIHRSIFYDANGERIVVRDGSSYTFTLRDLGQQVVREVSWSQASGWRWGKDYVYRDGVLLASQSTSDGLRYHFPDHLTSPRLVANRCGERLLEHRTNSFGLDLPSGSSQSPDRMRFTMHERDLGQLSTTLDDLDHMHARTYWPSLGRFASVDPGRDNDPKVPQSWNLYAYVRNNPVRFTDPDGLLTEDEVKRAAQGAAATTGTTLVQDAQVRQQYVQQVSQLSPTDTVARTAAKEAARQASSPVAQNLAEAMRPISGEAARAGGTASKTSVAVNEGMAVAGKGGVVLVVVGATISASNVAGAPPGQRVRVASEEAGAWVGALSFGAAGAKGGAALGVALGGPVGGVVGGTIGGIGGGVIGAFAGAKAGDNIYDATVGP